LPNKPFEREREREREGEREREREREREVKVYHHRQTCFFTEEAKTTENVNKPPTQTPCSSLLTATEKKKILKGEKRERKK